MACNCESSKCDHEAGACHRHVTGRRLMYVGLVCDQCWGYCLPAFRAAQGAADTLLASLESEISDLKRENALDVGSLVVLTDAPGGAIWRVVDIASGEALIESEGGRRFWRPVSRLTVVSGTFRTLNPAAIQ